MLVRALSFAVLGSRRRSRGSGNGHRQRAARPTPWWGSRGSGPGKRRPDPRRHTEFRTPLPRPEGHRQPGAGRSPQGRGAPRPSHRAVGALRGGRPAGGGAGRSWLIAGELSLDGCVRPIRGALSQALLARNLGIPGVITPVANGEEARLVPGIRVAAVRSLREAAAILTGEDSVPPTETEGRSPGRPGAIGSRRSRSRARSRTARTSSASRWRGARWKSRRRDATRCSWWDRRGAERRCWRSGCRESCRPSLRRRRSKRPGSTARPANRPGPAPSCAGRSGRPIPRSPRPACWAAGTRRGRERSPSPTAACCSSTNSPNSAPRPGKRSGSRSSRGRSASRAPAAGTVSPAGSCCWRRPTRARAETRATPGTCAAAPRRPSTGSPGKFSGPLLDRIDLSVSVLPVAVEAWSGEPRGRDRPRRSGAGSTPAGRLQEARYAGRPHRANGTVRAGTAELLAGALARGEALPHAGRGAAVPVGTVDREGVPRRADDRRPGRRAPGGAPPRRGSPPVPHVGVRSTGGIHVSDGAPSTGHSLTARATGIQTLRTCIPRAYGFLCGIRRIEQAWS